MIICLFPIEYVDCEVYVLFHFTGGLLTIFAISVLMCCWSIKKASDWDGSLINLMTDYQRAVLGR